MKRARKEPEHAFASGAEIKVFAWVEGGIATGESVTASGSPYVMTAIPEQPPTVLTVIGFGDCAANFDLIERLVLDHQSTGGNIIRYRDDTSGRRENKLVRRTGDRSEVLVSYEGFNFDDEGDRELLDISAPGKPIPGWTSLSRSRIVLSALSYWPVSTLLWVAAQNGTFCSR
jgi:hypothetical protein